MSRNKKTSPRRFGMQLVTLCISTMMVLVLIGLMVLSVQATRNVSAYVREHLTVTVMLGDSVTEQQGILFGKRLQQQPYARQVEYISKERALREQSEAMGSDPSEFLGVNPFVATLEMRLVADYANGDSLKMIAAELMQHHKLVSEVAYQEDLTDRVNQNLNRLSLVLFVLAILLIVVCYALISNSVRLSVYARRFDIHTMKLVGASWGFIRMPFLKRACGVGLVAAVLACGALGGLVYAAYHYHVGFDEVLGLRELLITGAVVLFFGLFITLLCSYISVNQFLKMKAGELYKI